MFLFQIHSLQLWVMAADKETCNNSRCLFRFLSWQKLWENFRLSCLKKKKIFWSIPTRYKWFYENGKIYRTWERWLRGGRTSCLTRGEVKIFEASAVPVIFQSCGEAVQRVSCFVSGFWIRRDITRYPGSDGLDQCRLWKTGTRGIKKILAQY